MLVELTYAFCNINKCRIQNFGKNICFTEKSYSSGIMGVNNCAFQILSTFLYK